MKGCYKPFWRTGCGAAVTPAVAYWWTSWASHSSSLLQSISSAAPCSLSVGSGLQSRCQNTWICHSYFILSMTYYDAAGLPSARILRGSLGLLAITFRGSLGNFKGSSQYETAAVQKSTVLHIDTFCPFYNSVLSDNATFVHFSCVGSWSLWQSQAYCKAFSCRSPCQYYSVTKSV